MKKDTILVLAIILIPIVILGAIAVNGASNLPAENKTQKNPGEGLNGTAPVIVPFQISQQLCQVQSQVSSMALI